ncbi:MAG: polymer-forming cytoskeletal protein [Alphaproteobacteria bacterium]|nr:polymer-forming cytoskeletal protein [Alphaproteobacteria bacterium]
MFFSGKDKSPNARKPGRRQGGEPISLISADLVVSGDLITPGDLQIDGVVEGDIRCESLTIGPSATISGNIFAEDVLIRGTLNGAIEARFVTLGKTAQVSGDILHETIAIEAGAIFDGRLTGRNRALGAAMEALPQPDGEVGNSISADEPQRTPSQAI